MSYFTTCDDTLVTYFCDPCATKEFAKISNVAFVKNTYYDTLNANPTDGSLWTAGINASLDIIIIPNVHGEMPLASEIVGTGYGRTVEELISFDRQVTFFDRRYVENCDFYNLIQELNSYHLAYFTETQGHITEIPVTIIPKAVIPDDIGAYVEWNVLVKWRKKTNPCPFTTPAGLFECFIP